MIWFGLVLRHVKHCGLCFAKSFLYIYIKYKISKLNFVDKIFTFFILNTNNFIYSESFIYTVKCFQVMLFDINNSIKHQSFFYPQLNDQAILLHTIQFQISHLFTLSLKYSTASEDWAINHFKYYFLLFGFFV